MVARGDLAAGGLLALLGGGVCVRAADLQIGSALDPKPGFFPFIGGVLLVGLAGLLMVQALRGGRPSSGPPVERLGLPALLVGGLAIYAALLERAGYPLMTALVAFLVLRVLGARWWIGAIVSVLLSVGSFALFVELGVPLPVGKLLGG